MSFVERKHVIVLLYADPFCGKNKQSAIGVPLLNAAIMAVTSHVPVLYARTQDWLSDIHFDGKDIHPTLMGHELLAERIGATFKGAI